MIESTGMQLINNAQLLFDGGETSTTVPESTSTNLCDIQTNPDVTPTPGACIANNGPNAGILRAPDTTTTEVKNPASKPKVTTTTVTSITATTENKTSETTPSVPVPTTADTVTEVPVSHQYPDQVSPELGFALGLPLFIGGVASGVRYFLRRRHN